MISEIVFCFYVILFGRNCETNMSKMQKNKKAQKTKQNIKTHTHPEKPPKKGRDSIIQ